MKKRSEKQIIAWAEAEGEAAAFAAVEAERFRVVRLYLSKLFIVVGEDGAVLPGTKAYRTEAEAQAAGEQAARGPQQMDLEEQAE